MEAIRIRTDGDHELLSIDSTTSVTRFNANVDVLNISAGVAIFGFAFTSDISDITFNPFYGDRDFIIGGAFGTTPFTYDRGNHTITTDATLVGFGGGGADGLSITDTVNLNLLDGTTVLSTVVLPSSSGTTVIQGTTGEIDVTTVGDTNTLSLAPVVTTAISDNTNAIALNTAKTGITTTQASAIVTNTAKVGITGAQANNITTNTAKNSYPAADATKLSTLSADSVDRQPDGSTTDAIKFWTGTQAQYDALTPVDDILYNITDTAASTTVCIFSS